MHMSAFMNQSAPHAYSARGSQERALDPLELQLLASCELPYRFWEPDSGPLQEYQVFLTPEPSFQPPDPNF